MKKRWISPPETYVPQALRDLVGGHPLVAKTLVRRGIATVEAARAFLDPSAYTPAPASDFPDLDLAVARITRAIQQRERICVWGDFDVDGQTSTTLLVATLRDLGADVIHHIPVRATESHGMKIPWLKQEIARGARLVLTCDTGVDAVEAVAHAKAEGVDVIITDHHELPHVLPPAYALVNPHRLPAGHPLETLPGVGVAYKLAEALYHSAERFDEVAQYLDLVALGIVADVAVQIGDTRYLLQRGLEALQHTERLGLQALMRLAKIPPSRVTEEDIGFGLAPRLNALGRLDDANVIVEFLTTTDLARARILASQLESLNARRKMLCEQVFQAAQAQIEQNPTLLDDAVLVLAQPSWPGGVIGIVANRLVDCYHRPVVLLTAPADGPARGSARSVQGCHITEAIAAQQDLLLSFGGHEMAAGLSLLPEHIPAFRRRLAGTVTKQLGKIHALPKLNIDAYLPLADLSLELVQDLARLGPFGAGNKALLLATKDLTIVSKRALGREGNHLRLVVEDMEGTTQPVVWWQWNDAALPESRFELAYTLRINEFRGERNLQMVWEDARETAVAPAVVKSPPLDIVDYRREPHPQTLLTALLAQDDVQVWREGAEAETIAGDNRTTLKEAATMVVWTVPPGPDEFRLAYEHVSPHALYLFSHIPGLMDVNSFLKYLAGLAKHVIYARKGQVQLEKLAALMAHCDSTVRLGLMWLEAQGHIQVTEAEDGMLYLQVGHGRVDDCGDMIAQHLESRIAETVAYRRYFSTAEITVLRASLLTSA